MAVGLIEKIEFRLIAPTGKVIDKPIQILVLDAFPETPEECWSDLVVKGFDTDIIKGVAQIDGNAYLERIVFSDEVRQNIHSGKFEYTMRPCHSFSQLLKRLLKYKRRGFQLASFNVDPRVSDAWRNHIRVQFNIMYGRHWIQELGELTDVRLFDEMVTAHIMPFIESRPRAQIITENRTMLRDAIRSEIDRLSGHDPRLALLMLLLEQDWEDWDRRHPAEAVAAQEEEDAGNNDET